MGAVLIFKSMRKYILATLLLVAGWSVQAEKQPVDYVNTFLGTAPLTNSAEIGFTPPWRKDRDHFREKRGEQRGKKPMGKTPQ